jgi:hypothetical protein
MTRKQPKQPPLGEIRRDALLALQWIRYFFAFSARFSACTAFALAKLRRTASSFAGLRDFPPFAETSS